MANRIALPVKSSIEVRLILTLLGVAVACAGAAARAEDAGGPSVRVLEPTDGAVSVVEGSPLRVRLGLAGSPPPPSEGSSSLCLGIRFDHDGSDFGVDPDLDALCCNGNLVDATAECLALSMAPRNALVNGGGGAAAHESAHWAWKYQTAVSLKGIRLGDHAVRSAGFSATFVPKESAWGN